MVNKGIINGASLPTKWCRISVINSFKLNLQFDRLSELTITWNQTKKGATIIITICFIFIFAGSKVHLRWNFAGSHFFHRLRFIYMGVSKNRGKTPQIIHLNRVFHYFHHPFWGVSPLFLETPIYSLNWLLVENGKTARSIKLDLMSQKLKRSDGKDSLMINLTAAFLGWICTFGAFLAFGKSWCFNITSYRSPRNSST